MFYNLTNKSNVKKAKEKLSYLIDKGANIELKEKRVKRTLKQNSYLHLLLAKFAMEFGYTIEQTKQDIFKRIVNRDVFILIKSGLEVCRSSKDLDTLEMTNCIEKFRNWSQTECNLSLPSPNETEFLNSIRNEMYKYENYQYL